MKIGQAKGAGSVYILFGLEGRKEVVRDYRLIVYGFRWLGVLRGSAGHQGGF
jgi:hypothetical protein